MKIACLIILIINLCSCSATIVYAPKTACIHGDDNKIEIVGSDLKGNSNDQESTLKIKWPWQ